MNTQSESRNGFVRLGKTIYLFVVSLAFSLYVQGGDLSPAPDKAQTPADADMTPALLNALVDELYALEDKTPTSVQLSQIGAAWKRLPEPAKGELREDVIYMSCAGLLAIGDMKSFGNARSAIPDMDAFREKIMGPCPECDGSGLVKSRCTSCGGSGRCGRCGGRGMIGVPHLAGARVPPPVVCGSCSGSGHCANCNNGMKEIRHAPCSGTGKRISRERSLEAFESHRAKAEEMAFSLLQKARGLVLQDDEQIFPSEGAERNRLAADENREVVISLDEMAKKVADFVAEVQSQSAPVVKGNTLEFSNGLIIGKSDIPLEKESRRIAFDFRTNGTTAEERGYTSIHLFTCDSADAVFITIREDGVFVQSRRDNAENAVKVSDNSLRWMYVDAVMKSDEVLVSVAGKKIVFPAMNGIRWSSFTFTVGKPNLQLRNIRSFPEKNHAAMMKLYLHGFFDAFKENPNESREGMIKLLKAAEGGLAEAQCAYATLAENYKTIHLEPSEIFQWYLKSARQGYVAAQSKVGQAYMTGNGTPKNHETAYKWFSKAAESREHTSLMLSGFLLMHSDTIPRDLKKAQDLLELAMLQEEKFKGMDKALLYEMYADSLILPDDETKNVKLGKYYLRMALQYGSKNARKKLNDLENMGY